MIPFQRQRKQAVGPQPVDRWSSNTLDEYNKFSVEDKALIDHHTARTPYPREVVALKLKLHRMSRSGRTFESYLDTHLKLGL